MTRDNRNVPVNPILRWLPQSPTKIENNRYAMRIASGITITQHLPGHDGPALDRPLTLQQRKDAPSSGRPRPAPTGSARRLCRRSGFAAAPEPAGNFFLLRLDEFLVVRRVEVEQRAAGGKVLHEDLADDICHAGSEHWLRQRADRPTNTWDALDQAAERHPCCNCRAVGNDGSHETGDDGLAA